ncbi:MAG TPA: tetraacyldisaccharide 4'-kinase, partial [Planctomycetota bacterium]|nr:tetraacyldisaccharide 4'-kinase [Planctomycetota bacterium]
MSTASPTPGDSGTDAANSTAGAAIPPSRPHWYAPHSSFNLRDQLKKWLGPSGDWAEHESVAGGAQLAVQGMAGLFGVLVAGRDFLYSHGVLRPYRASLPVISVGNLTTGGAGKTPFVAMLANWLRNQGYRPAVVARGYGAARVGRPNDEMMELDLVLNNPAVLKRGPASPAVAAITASGSGAAIAVSAAGSGSQFTVVPGAAGSGQQTAYTSGTYPTVASASALAAGWAIPMIASPARRYGAVLAEQLGADVVILDDGMQHRQIARDLDIVLLDARDPLGPGSNDAGRGPLEGGDYLPRGHMREGLWALERAGLIVIARTSLATPLWLQRLVEELRVRVPDVPIVLADHRPADLIPHPALVGKKRHSPQSLEKRRIGAFCGIASP